jgi:hypothetical protein
VAVADVSVAVPVELVRVVVVTVTDAEVVEAVDDMVE